MEDGSRLGRPAVEWAGRMTVVESKFDSDVFGYRVGKVEMGSRPPFWRPHTPFDVVFVKVDEWVYPEVHVEALDYRYEMELPGKPLSSGGSFIRAPQTPPETLKQLAREAFVGSRFFRDERLREKAPELYARWLEGEGRCWTLPDFADDAFLLQTWDGDVARISLIAVRGQRRGEGLGRKLMEGVLSSIPAPSWKVCVSAGNVQAVQFYLSAGFKIVSCSTAYHIWA